ncbi:MAG TPA: hypothetical protein VFS09_03820 [Candidatus Eisenbacteria bacterium]|nr:hypothetical protein [Candidatus Eisenbacteria bacterium]
MTIRSSLRLVSALSLALLAAVLVGCSKDATAPKPQPLAPETELTYAPLQGDTAGFRVHLFWNGYDRDGEVATFRFAIDSDTLELDMAKWKSTASHDTTLLLPVDPVKNVRGHVFWVSAEDNDGNIDPTPAKRYFSTSTIAPVSNIVLGPTAWNPLVPPNFRFEWEGTDPDGGETGGPAPCDSFETLLLRIGAMNDPNTPPTHQPLPPFNYSFYVDLINASVGDTLADPRYGDWRWEGTRAKGAQMSGTPLGEYVFALRAVDLAGAKEKNLAIVRNIRHFTVTSKNVGPTLSIAYRNVALPPAMGPIDFERREFQILEGEIVSFAWSATAESYGGLIVGFTYALDDTLSLPPLDIRNAGVIYRPSDLSVGAHFLFVRVVDDTGLQTSAVIPFRIVHPTFKDPVSALNPPQYLYVDDSLSPGVNNVNRFFNFPSDAEEDEWWRVNVLTPLSLQYGVGRRDWDTYFEGTVNGGYVRAAPLLTDLAACRVVIWNVDFNNQIQNPTALFQTLVGGGLGDLSSYLRAGGTLILNGSSIATSIVSPTTALTANLRSGICAAFPPGTAGYAQTFFPREMMGIDGARSAEEALRRQGARDFLEARVTAEGVAAGYASAEVDTGETAKWNGKIVPGEPETSWAPGLVRIEGWRMASSFNCDFNEGLYRREDFGRPISTPLFTYHGAPTGIYMMSVGGVGGADSPREGLVVGVQLQAHDLGQSGGGIISGSSTGDVIGRIVVLGFPMYFLKDPEATSLMKTAFGYVNASPTLPTMP